MAEWIAKGGTTALGIIGTALGGLAVANGGAGNLLGGILGGNRAGIQDPAVMAAMGAAIPALVNSAANSGALEAERKVSACEIELIKSNYDKDMQLAELRAEQKMDAKVLDLYKWTDGKLNELREQENAKWTEQAVLNATVNTGLTTLHGQVADVASTVASITKTVIPQSSICDTGCGCSRSCGNV